MRSISVSKIYCEAYRNVQTFTESSLRFKGSDTLPSFGGRWVAWTCVVCFGSRRCASTSGEHVRWKDGTHVRAHVYDHVETSEGGRPAEGRCSCGGCQDGDESLPGLP